MIKKFLTGFWEAFISSAFAVIIITWFWHAVIFALVLMLGYDLNIWYGVAFAAHTILFIFALNEV